VTSLASSSASTNAADLSSGSDTLHSVRLGRLADQEVGRARVELGVQSPSNGRTQATVAVLGQDKQRPTKGYDRRLTDFIINRCLQKKFHLAGATHQRCADPEI